MAKPKRPSAFEPHVRFNPASISGARVLVMEQSFCAVHVVETFITFDDEPGVRNRLVMESQLPHYKIDENTPLQSAIAGLKEMMLQRGATPEAVRLVGNYSPFTEKELAVMADKLKTKGAGKPAKAAKEPAAAKSKGNPEALKKAQEAREGKRAESHARKIKLLVKSKDAGLRGGRLAKLKAIEDNKPKTVGDILGTEVTDDAGKTHKVDMGALNGMVARGHIELSA